MYNTEPSTAVEGSINLNSFHLPDFESGVKPASKYSTSTLKQQLMTPESPSAIYSDFSASPAPDVGSDGMTIDSELSTQSNESKIANSFEYHRGLTPNESLDSSKTPFFNLTATHAEMDSEMYDSIEPFPEELETLKYATSNSLKKAAQKSEKISDKREAKVELVESSDSVVRSEAEGNAMEEEVSKECNKPACIEKREAIANLSGLSEEEQLKVEIPEGDPSCTICARVGKYLNKNVQDAEVSPDATSKHVTFHSGRLSAIEADRSCSHNENKRDCKVCANVAEKMRNEAASYSSARQDESRLSSSNKFGSYKRASDEAKTTCPICLKVFRESKLADKDDIGALSVLEQHVMECQERAKLLSASQNQGQSLDSINQTYSTTSAVFNLKDEPGYDENRKDEFNESSNYSIFADYSTFYNSTNEKMESLFHENLRQEIKAKSLSEEIGVQNIQNEKDEAKNSKNKSNRNLPSGAARSAGRNIDPLAQDLKEVSEKQTDTPSPSSNTRFRSSPGDVTLLDYSSSSSNPIQSTLDPMLEEDTDSIMQSQMKTADVSEMTGSSNIAVQESRTELETLSITSYTSAIS